MRPQDLNQQNKRPQREIDDRLITNTRMLPEKIRLIDTRPGAGAPAIVSREEVYRLIQETGLSLIYLDRDASPPVVKLLDYGKFKFEEEKRKREFMRKQHEQARGLKEFYFGINTTDHDCAVKIKHIQEALAKNYDVKIGVKNNGETRRALKRYQTLEQASREEDFVLRRVLKVLGESVKAGNWSYGQGVSINLKKATP